MELQTASQVSQDYGVSTRMLRYYEQIGLIESSRKDDYAYRVYDEDAIKRLQQIIILRKLQLPVKQIRDILNNQDAVTVIEIFKQNISELDEEITVLSTLKSILMRFINELQEKADVHLKLDLLNDKTILAVVDSLSFTKHKIKEKVSIEELNKVSEQFDKINDKSVRVVYLPPATVASAYDPDESPDLMDEKHEGGATIPILQKFIDDVDLFKIKPDTRVYGFGDTKNGKRVYIMWATIPDDLDVPAPLEKMKFYGGLYATTHDGESININEWVENSDNYDGANGGTHRPAMAEFINPISMFGKKSIGSEAAGSTYVDSAIPIKEINKLPDDVIKTALMKLEKSILHGKPTEIDLGSMIKQGNFESKYIDGSIVMKMDGENQYGMVTPQQFNCPMKIEMRAKTDDTNITIKYAKGILVLNWEAKRSSLLIFDISDGKFNCYKKCGEVPINEFVDIEWILGREEMVLKINGELRHFNNDYSYIKAFNENPDYRLSSTVTIKTGYGSTVTVEKLRVIEI